jgi:hypothetical protein
MSDLFRYQRATVQRIIDAPRSAIFLPVGYGKTAAVLTALSELDQWPVLVVAPARVAKRVWSSEAAEWEHLRNLQVVSIHGSPGQRSKRLGWDNHVECISYENLLWLSEAVDIDKRYKAIVFDELSKMKNPGAKRFRRMRARCMKVPIRIGLTGTPVGNNLLDLWGEMYMVGGEGPLGPTFSQYRDRYFEAQDYFQREWEVKSKKMESEIHRRVAPWCYVLPPQPEVKIPPVVVNRVDLEVPEAVEAMTKHLEKELFVTLESGVEMEALSASTVAGKLRQIASGAVYPVSGEGAWEAVHDEKLHALSDIVDELQGEPLLVFYWFKHEAERIKAAIPGVVGIDEKGAIDRWNRREVKVLLCHPQSAGHGLNLQPGGSTICWFTLPWSHELWIQANGRLARTGQKAPVVMTHVLTFGEMDKYVLRTLAEKAGTERRLLDTLLG